MLKIAKAVPFGANFSTRLEGANNKLVCALSLSTTCSDDTRPRPLEPEPFNPGPLVPIEPILV